MAQTKSCNCEDKLLVKDIQTFLGLETTLTSEGCFNYWNGKDPSLCSKVKFSDASFEDAYKVHAVSGEIYKLFSKTSCSQTLQCQSVFSNWGGGEFYVDFWMKDVS